MKFFSSLKQVLTVVLAGLLLLVSTACDRVNAQTAPGGGRIVPGQEQPFQGGMNNFKDVDDTRLNTDTVDAKAKALRDRVQKNINEKGIDSVDQYVDNYRSGTPLNERIENIGKDVRRGTENTLDNTKQATDRLGDKTARTADDAKETVNRAGTKAGRAVDDAKTTADRLSDKAGRTLGNAKADAKAAAKNAEPEAKSAIDKVADFVKDKTDDTAGAAKRAID